MIRPTLLPFAVATLALLAGCGGSSERPAAKSETPAPAATPAPPPKPADESRRLPKTNLVDSEVVATKLLGKDFMPGGTIGHYKKGKTSYDIFIAKTSTPDTAALLLPDWRKALTNAKLVPSFGGYFGQDSDGRPIFVFTKGNYIAGIAGLVEKDADLEARGLAGRL
jgi:hypothetical protein